MARLWRLYHPDLPGKPGSVVVVAADESRHARKVLRLREGEPVAVFDGNGHEWIARISGHEGDCVTLLLEEPISDPVVEAPLEVVLYQALLRPERMDWVVQKATEIGVRTLHPFLPQRAESYRLGQERLRRWHRIAVESSKQCGRRMLPRIEPLTKLPAPEGAGTLALLLHPAEPSRSLAAVCTASPPSALWLAVGPQGGFTPEEAGEFAAVGWIPTALGPRVLRADTAGVVAASILLHRWADLGS